MAFTVALKLTRYVALFFGTLSVKIFIPLASLNWTKPCETRVS
jgi:hypothetical protein